MASASSSLSNTATEGLTPAFNSIEHRLNALCELIDEELRSGVISDDELATYRRRLTGEVDQALTEETRWYSASDFI